MTDRELLEYAAKAEGTVQWVEDAGGWCTMEPDMIWACAPWEPLDDDGDALRLAVKLKFVVACYEDTCEVEDLNGNMLAFEVGDPYAATRRAIVRAAAEIGKEMK